MSQETLPWPGVERLLAGLIVLGLILWGASALGGDDAGPEPAPQRSESRDDERSGEDPPPEMKESKTEEKKRKGKKGHDKRKDHDDD